MTAPTASYPMQGGCACGEIRYTLHAPPMITHCCHCTECQVQSGSAFNINVVVEHFNITHDKGEPELSRLGAASGDGQTVARCSQCRTLIWSNYGGAGHLMRFLRAGTLDKDASGQDPLRGHIKPDVHIYTKNKAPWVIIPDGERTFEEFYGRDTWSSESVERRNKLFAQQSETS